MMQTIIYKVFYKILVGVQVWGLSPQACRSILQGQHSRQSPGPLQVYGAPSSQVLQSPSPEQDQG